jgi:hypothetical protein
MSGVRVEIDEITECPVERALHSRRPEDGLSAQCQGVREGPFCGLGTPLLLPSVRAVRCGCLAFVPED